MIFTNRLSEIESQLATNIRAIYDLDTIPVYCANTGAYLYELDDNTIAYFQTIDPTATVVSRVLSGHIHPTLQLYKSDNYISYWETCPILFISYLLGKVCTFATTAKDSYLWTRKLHLLNQAIEYAYNDDRIDDEYMLKILGATLCNRILWKSLTNTYQIPDSVLSNPEDVDNTMATLADFISHMETCKNKINLAEVSKALAQSYDFYDTSLIATYGNLCAVDDGMPRYPKAKNPRQSNGVVIRELITPKFYLNSKIDLDVSILRRRMQAFDNKYAARMEQRASTNDIASSLTAVSSALNKESAKENTLALFNLLASSTNTKGE